MTNHISDEGFIQDYELHQTQELWLYCRMCRKTFAVYFKPKTDQVKLQCLCGHAGRLATFDVFRDESAASEHAAFYDRVYYAAKGALADAGLALPPSGKYDAIDPHNDPEFESYTTPDDESAIEAGYLDPSDERNLDESEIAGELDDYDRRVKAATNALDKHELLSDLIEFAYCRRFLSDGAMVRFLEACAEDIELAEEAIQEARERKKRGHPIRLSFTSFKHLIVHLEAEEAYEKALLVAERAVELGLKNYVERMDELRERLQS